MTYLKFDKTQLINLEYSLSKEIVRSNRAGSYWSTTLVFCNTRKYHGLLVTPIENLDGERHVLLSAFDETIVENKSEFNLGIHKYQGDVYSPKGHKYLRDFHANPIPTHIYRVGGVIIKKESLLVGYKDLALLRYTILESDLPIKLRFRPFLAFRNIHALSKANMYANTKVKPVVNGIKSRLYDGYPYLHMQFSKKVEFIQVPDWYYNIEYSEELKRGYDYKEDLFVPGYFEMSAKKGDVIFFSASTEEQNPDNLKTEFETDLNKRIPRICFKNCLANAAQQFIVRKDKKTEIIAGFPWFGAWGRDTFISLPGLTLSIDDARSCKDVLDTMVNKLKGGLFPNMGSDENPAFNSVDAPLWFFWSVQQYAHAIKSYVPLWTSYGKAMKSILEAYRDGTSYGIKMHGNGLIYAGEKGKALTWMDAVVNGKPITPRSGYAVEINALWYNAVMFALELAKKAKDISFTRQWSGLPETIKESFLNLFWDNAKGYLADVVDESSKDWSIRPNQVIAIALEYAMPDNEMKKSVLTVIERDLLTPRGLRTLSPQDEKYKGIYEGNQEKRDKAYHQGTVWPWLLEHYCECYLNLHKESGLYAVKEIVNRFEETINEYGVGTIAEIYDGDPPHHPRGAISQAWSVAALLRIIEKIEKFSEDNSFNNS
ncbi:MAG: glycogen debranching enzyme family protein [Bacteroidales bacterium]|nr:glycogen debranching enzyme family protein [Bacteroidales bacterium]